MTVVWEYASSEPETVAQRFAVLLYEAGHILKDAVGPVGFQAAAALQAVRDAERERYDVLVEVNQMHMRGMREALEARDVAVGLLEAFRKAGDEP